MHGLNPWAILIAAASTFAVGGVWYSAGMFGNIWQREARDTRPMNSNHPLKVFAVSLLFALIAVTALAEWLGPHPALSRALWEGFIAGACFVSASFGISYQFADLSMKLWLINAGFFTLQFTVYGLVLGLVK